MSGAVRCALTSFLICIASVFWMGDKREGIGENSLSFNINQPVIFLPTLKDPYSIMHYGVIEEFVCNAAYYYKGGDKTISSNRIGVVCAPPFPQLLIWKHNLPLASARQRTCFLQALSTAVSIAAVGVAHAFGEGLIPLTQVRLYVVAAPV